MRSNLVVILNEEEHFALQAYLESAIGRHWAIIALCNTVS